MNFWLNKKLIKMNNLILLLLILISIYLFILISTYLFQRNLLYHPGENNYSGDQILVSIEKVKKWSILGVKCYISRFQKFRKSWLLPINPYLL